MVGIYRLNVDKRGRLNLPREIRIKYNIINKKSVLYLLSTTNGFKFLSIEEINNLEQNHFKDKNILYSVFEKAEEMAEAFNNPFTTIKKAISKVIKSTYMKKKLFDQINKELNVNKYPIN